MKPTTRIILIISFALIGFDLSSFGQIKDIGNFVSTGSADGEKLLQAYISPYLSAFGASMTGGWYNTAKPHKLGGFDLTATVNVAFVPTSGKTFNVDELGLTNLRRASGSEINSPTIAGKNTAGPLMQYNIGGYTADAFTLPQGTNNRYIPSPMLQLGVGLVKGTDIIGRYMPTYTVGGNNVGMWGVGLKHSISQWIPLFKRLKVLNIAVMGGYTKLNGNLNLSVEPANIGAGSLPEDPSINSHTWENQKMKFDVSSLTANLIVSANLPVISFYGGVGFANTKTNLKLIGNYPLIQLNNLQPTVYSNTDPVDFKIKNKDGSVTKPRYNLGMRLKLSVITIQFDYTKANYNVFTAGLGISIR